MAALQLPRGLCGRLDAQPPPRCAAQSQARTPQRRRHQPALGDGACSCSQPSAGLCPERPLCTERGRSRRRGAGECVRAMADQAAKTDSGVPAGCVSIVLLAGGVGKRMGAKVPKQYIDLRGQPIATYSMQTFAKMKEVGEIVVVCDPSWRYVFEECAERSGMNVPMRFASPGPERQDSVYNGLQEVSPSVALVAIHDSARPLVRAEDVLKCVLDAWDVGAAVLGVRVKPTIKEVDDQGHVVQTLVRSRLWEVQTPQVIRPDLLKQGFELVRREGLEVTDDVSIVEAMGGRVVVTEGSYTNLKITTPEDMAVAEGLLDDMAPKAAAAAAS
ncbi:unnamed protein product [Ostreobium quekettii]|uniref:2-C-methyl-D-erythritol 4-phosphate cytidylyltransferase, chloroplastic n=1 Tax=Ostreobium quekettii TaxID=121088 RepID=A0A8S1IV31_9CHLO|nr:unnamed protein product [Ostreobium quekettii]|eukprot:evm.model.scf_185.3 EVM.evm.TU.scf_185.3   scf_185:30484-35152(+)